MILVVCLLCLIILLFFMYKKLSKESNGEYTIRNMVYKDGGIRDQLRGVALTLGSRFGVELWPADNLEMQEVRDEEPQDQNGESRLSEMEEKNGKAENKDSNSSDDESSMEDSEAGVTARLTDEPEREEKGEEKEEKLGDEGNGGAELLINVNQFSGSAIWSEEQVKFSEVTPL